MLKTLIKQARLGGLVLLALCVFALGSSQAKADTLIPNLVSVVASGGGWTWTYDVTLTAGARIESGDFFTVYDFQGYVAGSAVTGAAGWSVAVANLGATPPLVLPSDSPFLPNLTWTYTGPTVIGPVPVIMSFSADSNSGSAVVGQYTSRDTKNAPGDPSDGTKASAIGDVEVPVPEPGSLILLGSLLLGLGLVRRSSL